MMDKNSISRIHAWTREIDEIACTFHAAKSIAQRDTNGQTYARLQFNVGPGGGMQIPVEVDYCRAFQASNHAAWDDEYDANVQSRQWMLDGGWPFDPAETDPRFFDSRVEDLGNWHDAFDDEPGGFLPPTTERRCDGES